jgi:transposase-like protein
MNNFLARTKSPPNMSPSPPSASPSSPTNRPPPNSGTRRQTNQRRRKRRHYNYTVKQKIAIVQQAYSKPNYVIKFAREYGLARDVDIRKWKRMLGKLKEKAQTNPHAKSVHKGPVVRDLEFEKDVKDWILEQREMDIAVRTKDIIYYATAANPSFKNSSQKTLIAWVYKFLGRHGLTVRRVTRIGQKLSGHLKEVQDDCANAIKKRMAVGGTLHGIDLKYFINMDQTAVYFEMKSSTTVDKVGTRTVSIRDSASNSKRATVVLAVAADGTKLPPFVVFKGTFLLLFFKPITLRLVC